MKVYGISRHLDDGEVAVDWTTNEETMELLLMPTNDGITTLVATLDLPEGLTPESIGLSDVIHSGPQAYILSLGYKDWAEYKRNNGISGYNITC